MESIESDSISYSIQPYAKQCERRGERGFKIL